MAAVDDAAAHPDRASRRVALAPLDDGLPADLADLALACLGTGPGSEDGAIVAHFPPGALPSEAELREGAARAFAAFPKSRCVLDGGVWRPRPSLPFRIEHVRCERPEQLEATLEQAVTRPLRIDRELGLEQLCVEIASTQRSVLVTRMHHALGDGVSIALWIAAQLGESKASGASIGLKLKSHPAPLRRSRYCFRGPSEKLGRVRGGRASGRRRFRTSSFDGTALKARLKGGPFTYSDVLASVAMETAGRWNDARGGGKKVGLWLPMNVRQVATEGFGNASSRIRVYRRALGERPWSERALALREQIRWSKEHGEWYLPMGQGRATRLPRWLLVKVLWLYVHRPWVDMGTLPFSHLERFFPADAGGHLAHIDRLEVVNQVYGPHQMVLAALGLGGQTHLTFTWDEGAFPGDAAERFLATFEALRASAFAELLGG